jgi:hypothetical protein
LVVRELERFHIWCVPVFFWWKHRPLQAAEKLSLALALKGHGFSCAEEALYLCHSERASAREEPAVLSFSAASLGR